jgi:hypothetical protein
LSTPWIICTDEQNSIFPLNEKLRSSILLFVFSVFFWFYSLALWLLWLLWVCGFCGFPCFAYLSICLSIYISTDLCIYLPINLSIPLPIYLPISIYLSTDLRLQLSVNEARSCPGRCLTTWAARRGPQWVMQDNCKLLFNQCGHWAHGSRQTVDCQCPCSIHRLTAWYARPGNITHGVGRKTTLPLQNFAIGTPNALVS